MTFKDTLHTQEVHGSSPCAPTTKTKHFLVSQQLVFRCVFAALRTAPDSARVHQALAESYVASGQKQQAMEEYREALRKNPKLPGVHMALGDLHGNAAEYESAEKEFRAEQELNPQHPGLLYRYGVALLKQGSTKEAEVRSTEGMGARGREVELSICSRRATVSHVMEP